MDAHRENLSTCPLCTPTAPARWHKRVGHGAAWLVPSVILAFMPKCPMCVAAYLALWTGLGLSVTAAGYFRMVLILLSASALLYLAVKRLRSVWRHK